MINKCWANVFHIGERDFKVVNNNYGPPNSKARNLMSVSANVLSLGILQILEKSLSIYTIPINNTFGTNQTHNSSPVDLITILKCGIK